MDCTQVLDCSDLEEVTYDQKVKVGKLKLKNEEFTVFSGKNIIGRDADKCSIVLNNMTLSKEHACIEVAQSNSHVIYDLGSKNKTKLGKVGLAPNVRYFLPDKTVLQFGEVLAEYIILEKTGKGDAVAEDSDDDMIPATPAQRSKFAPELSSNSTSPTLFEVSSQCDCGIPETCGKLLGEPCGINFGKQTSKVADLDQVANNGACSVSSKDFKNCKESNNKDICFNTCSAPKEIAVNKDCSLIKSADDEDSLTDDDIYCAATQDVSSAYRDFKGTRPSDIPRSIINETLNSSSLSESSVRPDTKQSLNKKSNAYLFEVHVENDVKKPMENGNNPSTSEKCVGNDLKQLVDPESKQDEINNLKEDRIFNAATQLISCVISYQQKDKQNIGKILDSKNIVNYRAQDEVTSTSEGDISRGVMKKYTRKEVQKNISVSTTCEVISSANDVDKNVDKCVGGVGEEAIDIYNACTQVVNIPGPTAKNSPNQQEERTGEATAKDIYNAATQILIPPGTVEKSPYRPSERSGKEVAKDILKSEVSVSLGPVLKESANGYEKETSILTSVTSEGTSNHHINKCDGSAKQNDYIFVAPTQILPPDGKIICKKEAIDLEDNNDLDEMCNNKISLLCTKESNQELNSKKSNIEGDFDKIDESFFSAPTQVVIHDTYFKVRERLESREKSPSSTSSTYSSIHEEPTQCMDEVATLCSSRITKSSDAAIGSAQRLPSKTYETIDALLPISSSSSGNINNVVKESFSSAQVISCDADVEVGERLGGENKSPSSTSSTYSSIHEEPTQCMDEVATSTSRSVVMASTPMLPLKACEKVNSLMPNMLRSSANVNNVQDTTSEIHDKVEVPNSSNNLSDGIGSDSIDLVLPTSEELLKITKTIYGNTSDSETEKNCSPVIRTRRLRSNIKDRYKSKKCLQPDLESSISSSEEMQGKNYPNVNNSEVALSRRSSRKDLNQERDNSMKIKSCKLKNSNVGKERNICVPETAKEKLLRNENVCKLNTSDLSGRPSRLRKMTWKMRESSHSPAADEGKKQCTFDVGEANSRENKKEIVPLKNIERKSQLESVSSNCTKSTGRRDKNSSVKVSNKNDDGSAVLQVDSITNDVLIGKKVCPTNKKETISSKKKGKESSRIKSKTSPEEKLTKKRGSVTNLRSPSLSENTFTDSKNNRKSFVGDLSAENRSTRRSTRSSVVETCSSATDTFILTSVKGIHGATAREKGNSRYSKTGGPSALLKISEKTERRTVRKPRSSVSASAEDNDKCPASISEECEVNQMGDCSEAFPKRKSSRIKRESTNVVSKKENAHVSNVAKLKELPVGMSVSNVEEKAGAVTLKRTSRKSAGAATLLDVEVISSRSRKLLEKSDTFGNGIDIKKQKMSDFNSLERKSSDSRDPINKLNDVSGSPVIQTRTSKFLKKDNQNCSEKVYPSKRTSTSNREKLDDRDKKSAFNSSSPKRITKSLGVASSSCDEDNENSFSISSKGKRQRLKKIKEEDCVPTPIRKLKRNVESESTESLSSAGESTPKRSCRLSQKPQYHVMFTGVSTSKGDENIIKKLGGKFVTEVEECSVLVTDKVRRTLKFLCILAQGKPIVSKDWILKSQRNGQFLDPWDFIVGDKEAEKKYKFQLKTSLKKACEKKLLDGYSVYATPSILPPPTEMKDIIEYSGGIFLSQEPTSGSWPEKSFVIATGEDKRLVTKLKKKSINIVTAEFILTGLLQQKLSFSEYVL